jgi:hypothetical protein
MTESRTTGKARGPDRLLVVWHDAGCEPQCPPNPAYPEGIDIHAPVPGFFCKTSLPYPAPRCGLWVVHCLACSAVVAVTAAGRPDDPRSVDVNCGELLP